MALFNYLILLDNLSNKDKPKWGVMTPQHMVEHLAQAVQSSNGKIVLSEYMPPTEKLPLLKRILLGPRPFPKNFVNTVVGSELRPIKNINLADAVMSLKTELDDLESYFKNNPTAKPINPTFGPLNEEEWIRFHEKHFTHHLKQFGLINE
jgi:oxepin-CoA hydrolase/3-oxo-5,6-dehydrosuberyl-CoA semialdehyde dehydrogenase